ncbi:MAG: protein kinase [Gemmatimonadetes bacterium]|nr:protein kinase [Gemmatimonadota bacterium]NIO30916.1 protein kinase [Gemmatimonadota bacterium]
MNRLADRLNSALADRYSIERELGSGGMAVVYLARDLRHERDVAIKVLRAELAAAMGADRFLREIKLTAKLNHPHILPLLDSGEAEGFLYYVMPYVAGESLRQRLERETQFPVDEALRITRQVAGALDFAHRQDVIHRDIKPENILLHEGEAMVADFGIALAVSAAGGERLTETGLSLGTPEYMSPEQALGEGEPDARSDIYSLGCVLYEMLVGEPPYTGPTAMAVLAKRLSDPVPSARRLRGAIPASVDAALVRALAKERVDRFGSAREFAEALVAEAGEDVEAVKSIVVLPFENLSPDPDNEYFADGLTDELIAQLSKIEALRVISRTSAMLFKDAQQSIPTIARKLGVRYALEGTVRRAGNSVRITAQLIDAATDVHLWAERYSGSLEDIFDLQEDLSRRIVEALQVTLSPRETGLTARRPVDPQAYDAYLRGRYHLEQATAEGRRRALEYFNQAIELDPDYARAHAALAETHAYSMMLAGVVSDEVKAQANEAVQKALELDPKDGVVHAISAVLKSATAFDWSGAEAEMQRALELSPQDTTVLHWYAHVLMALDRLDESMALTRRILEIDPLSPMMNAHLAAEHYCRRDYDRAIDQAKKTAEMDPGYATARGMLGMVYERMGRYAESVAAFAEGMALRGESAEALAAFRNRYETEGMPGIWRWRATTRPPKDRAVAYAYLGDKEAALEWLTRALQEQPLTLVGLKTDPAFDGLRADPRFQSVLEQMNLA